MHAATSIGRHLRSPRSGSTNSVGGPVIIPKDYNGKNRTFFFADYEGLRNTTQSFVLGNVPTLKERVGDFSEVETTPGVANIYDP
jgi:hypothetical protein